MEEVEEEVRNKSTAALATEACEFTSRSLLLLTSSSTLPSTTAASPLEIDKRCLSSSPAASSSARVSSTCPSDCFILKRSQCRILVRCRLAASSTRRLCKATAASWFSSSEEASMTTSRIRMLPSESEAANRCIPPAELTIPTMAPAASSDPSAPLPSLLAPPVLPFPSPTSCSLTCSSSPSNSSFPLAASSLTSGCDSRTTIAY
mmetsp:Transcript_50716/g.158444  ORF Transcript_50716/g.158444 Transcript_50716/m.158444 type:complete len:205 (-) Transcript_50716:1963-2577(-)